MEDIMIDKLFTEIIDTGISLVIYIYKIQTIIIKHYLFQPDKNLKDPRLPITKKSMNYLRRILPIISGTPHDDHEKQSTSQSVEPTGSCAYIYALMKLIL
jgi:hypothetical protein